MDPIGQFDEHVYHIQRTSVQNNRRSMDGFSSVTGSGQFIHVGCRSASKRVRILETQYLAEIYRLQVSDLEIWKEETK